MCLCQVLDDRVRKGEIGIVNGEIKIAAMRAEVKLWRVAEALGMADTSLSRKLRHELSDEEKTEILGIIKRLKEEKANG